MHGNRHGRHALKPRGLVHPIAQHVGHVHDKITQRACEQITFNAAAFAPEALPPSLKLRRTAVALAEAGRQASPMLGNYAERRRETAEAAKKKRPRISQRALRSNV